MCWQCNRRGVSSGSEGRFRVFWAVGPREPCLANVVCRTGRLTKVRYP